MCQNQHMLTGHDSIFCDGRKDYRLSRAGRKNEQGFRPALFPFFFYAATGFFLIRSKFYRHFLSLLYVVRNVIVSLVVVLAIRDFRAASHADKIIAPPSHLYFTALCGQTYGLEKSAHFLCIDGVGIDEE